MLLWMEIAVLLWTIFGKLNLVGIFSPMGLKETWGGLLAPTEEQMAFQEAVISKAGKPTFFSKTEWKTSNILMNVIQIL